MFNTESSNTVNSAFFADMSVNDHHRTRKMFNIYCTNLENDTCHKYT